MVCVLSAFLFLTLHRYSSSCGIIHTPFPFSLSHSYWRAQARLSQPAGNLSFQWILRQSFLCGNEPLHAHSTPFCMSVHYVIRRLPFLSFYTGLRICLLFFFLSCVVFLSYYAPEALHPSSISLSHQASCRGLVVLISLVCFWRIAKRAGVRFILCNCLESALPGLALDWVLMSGAAVFSCSALTDSVSFLSWSERIDRLPPLYHWLLSIDFLNVFACL